MESDIDQYKQSVFANNDIIGNLPPNVEINKTLNCMINTLKTDCTVDDVIDIKILSSKYF